MRAPQRAHESLALGLAEGADAAAQLEAADHAGAAAEVRAGRPLVEVLATHTLLPPVYLAAFEVGAINRVRAIVDAARRHQARAWRAFATIRTALVSAGLAWGVMAVASIWLIPTLLDQFTACDQALPTAVVFGIALFSAVGSTVGIVLAAAVFGGLWWGAHGLWRRSPMGRRSEDTWCLSVLAELVCAGLHVPDALRRIARATRRGARFSRAAESIESGAPLGSALVQLGVCPMPPALLDRPRDALPGVLVAIASIREAEESACAAHTGQWTWAIYAICIGAIALAFAGLVVGSTLAVLECVG